MNNEYRDNFNQVLSRIEAARLEADEHRIIKIIAASKYVDATKIEDMYKTGQRSFGENRIQDFKVKEEILRDLPIEWHYIGRIQTNKINALLDLNPSLIHSCENFEMAIEIDKRAKVKNKKVNILLQINSAKEDTKAGISPELAISEYHKIQKELDNVTLKGIMSIGANSEDEKEVAKSFDISSKIFETLKKDGAKYCSMGMSGDFELAIKHGSNMLRLGSILFHEDS